MIRRDYLDEVEEQLVRATARGSARSRRRELFAVLPAIAAAAAIIAIVLLTVGHGGAQKPPAPLQQTAHHGHSSPPPARHRSGPAKTGTTTQTVASATATGHPYAPGGPVPSGFAPESFTALSDTTWWLLGNAPCSDAPCTSLVRTQDGGRSFVGLPAPRTSGVDQVRFATAQDGYAYGPQLWATTDGGEHWSEQTPQNVDELETNGGYVYAISGSTSGSAGRLIRAIAGTNDWTTLTAAGEASGGLWVVGRTVIVQSSAAGNPVLMISHDSGATFAREPLPNGALSCTAQQTVGGTLWATCATGTLAQIYQSTDGGADWQNVGAGGISEIPNSAPFAATSADDAVVVAQPQSGIDASAGSGYRLMHTTSGGANAAWTSVGPAGGAPWSYVGFTDSTHGVAIGQFDGVDRLYYTTDGGASYHPVTIAGS